MRNQKNSTGFSGQSQKLHTDLIVEKNTVLIKHENRYELCVIIITNSSTDRGIEQ